MKKGLLVALCLLLILAVPVLAATYTLVLQLVESGSTDYGMTGWTATSNNTYYADNGYMAVSGNDTAMDDSGTPVPFMMATDRITFATTLPALQTKNLNLTFGNTPSASPFSIVPGDGGYVIVSDNNTSMEGSDNCSAEFEAPMPSSGDVVLLDKAFSLVISAGSSGNVTVQYGTASSITQTTRDNWISCYAGTPGGGERINSFPISTITQVSFYLGKVGAPVGTGYVYVRRVSDDAIIGTVGTIDVSTIGAGAWYDFTTTPVDNPSVQDLRVVFEYFGGSGANNIQVGQNTAGGYAGGVLTYDGDPAWTDDGGGHDATFKVYASPTPLTAAGITLEKHVFKFWQDSVTAYLTIDGVDEDTGVAVALPNTSSDWILENMPYMNYFKFSVGGVLKCWLQPTSMIYGTFLPDRAIGNSGVITWGANPGGTAASFISFTGSGGATGLTSAGSSSPAIVLPSPGMATANASATGGGEHATFFFYDFFKGIVNQINAPNPANPAYTPPNMTMGFFWQVLASVTVFLGVAISLIMIKEPLVSMIVGDAIVTYWINQKVFDPWVLVIGVTLPMLTFIVLKRVNV